MKALSKHACCGLLLVVLGSAAVACGDDQADDHRTDGGTIDDAGHDRPLDGGDAGRSGAGGAGGGRDGGGVDGGGSDLTPAQCRETAVQTAGAACVACVCEAGPDETVACGPDCWALVACIQARCGGDGSDIPCITSLCDAFLTDDAPVQAIGFDPILRMCAGPCVAPILDAGSDVDLDAGG